MIDESTLDNELVTQKNTILTRINDGALGEALAMLTVVCPLWTACNYGYKWRECMDTISKAIAAMSLLLALLVSPVNGQGQGRHVSHTPHYSPSVTQRAAMSMPSPLPSIAPKVSKANKASVPYSDSRLAYGAVWTLGNGIPTASAIASTSALDSGIASSQLVNQSFIGIARGEPITEAYKWDSIARHRVQQRANREQCAIRVYLGTTLIETIEPNQRTFLTN